MKFGLGDLVTSNKLGVQVGDSQPISHFVSKTVQDRPIVTINH